MDLILTTPEEVTRVLPRIWLGTIWNAKLLRSENPGVGLVLNCTDEVLPRIPGVLTLQLACSTAR